MFTPASLNQAWVVADLGGTHARFACVTNQASGLQALSTLRVADFADFAAALQHYQQSLQAQGMTTTIQALGLAIAAPILPGQLIKFTNNHWSINTAEIRREFNLQQLSLLNDFAALALSVPHLQASQLRHWPGSPSLGPFRQGDRLAVIGPGTGLGVASLYFHQGVWHALPSEAGHITLTPETELECQLWHYLRRDYPCLSAETIFSGRGLSRLYQALAAVRQATLGDIVPDAASLLQNAEHDALCAETLSVFLNWLGSYLGNQILNLGARQGLFLAGGILPRCQPQLFASGLYQRLLNKPGMSNYLRDVPLYLLTDTMTALHGMYQDLQQQLKSQELMLAA